MRQVDAHAGEGKAAVYRVLTVSREYGSGGANIALIVAGRLNWSLLDNNIIAEIVRAAKVDPELARRYDERVDSWAFEGVADPEHLEVFDAETMAPRRVGRRGSPGGRSNL